MARTGTSQFPLPCSVQRSFVDGNSDGAGALENRGAWVAAGAFSLAAVLIKHTPVADAVLKQNCSLNTR